MSKQQSSGLQAFPLSFFQERHLLYHRLNPLASRGHAAPMFRLYGQLDRAALEQSLAELQQRHSILRTIYPDTSPDCQIILPSTASCLSFIDLRHADAANAWQQQAANTFNRPFDLAQEAPIRCELLQVADQAYVLYLVVHPIALDQRSYLILLQELQQLYTAFAQGLESQLPPSKAQYKDYALWQRQQKQSEAWPRQAAWWLQTLAGDLPASTLPPDLPAAASTGVADQRVTLSFPPELAERIRLFTKTGQVSLFVLLFSAFNAFVHEITRETDIVIGVPVSARNSGDLERTVGLFVHNVIFRTDLSGTPTFAQLLQQTAHNTRAVLMHRDFPLYLLSELEPTRVFSRRNLNKIDFNLYHSYGRSFRLPGLEVEEIPLAPVYSPDIGLDVNHRGMEGIEMKWLYDAGQYSQACVEAWAAHYRTLLERMLSQPDTPLQK